MNPPPIIKAAKAIKTLSPLDLEGSDFGATSGVIPFAHAIKIS